MKKPKCKYCGAEGHYAFQCYQKAKAEYALERKISPLGEVLSSKTIKHPSRKKSARKRLINELDHLTSLLVRASNADENGQAYCFTCGVRKPYQQLDCGHYRSRRYLQTRFDLNQLRVQCVECNRYKHGNLEIFRKKLVRELGEDKVREIETRPPVKILDVELEQMIETRKKDLANLTIKPHY